MHMTCDRIIAEQAGGTGSEQSLDTNTFGEVTGTTRFKIWVENPAAFRLDEFSE